MFLRSVSLLLLLCGPLIQGLAMAQDPADLPSLADIQARLDALEPAVEGQADPMGPRREQLRALLQAQTEEVEHLASVAEFRSAIDEVPARLADLRARLAQPLKSTEAEPGPEASVADLEAAAAQAVASADAARRSEIELEAESTRRKARIPAVRDEIAEVAQLVVELESRVAAAPPVEADSESRKISGWVRQAELDAARARLAALEAERDSLDARKELLPLRKDAAQRQGMQASSEAEALRLAAAKLQRLQADREVEAAEERLNRYAESLMPLQDLAAELQEFAIEAASPDGLIQRRETVEIELTKVDADIEELKRRLKKTRNRIILAGRSEGMGAILRREFEALPTLEDETRTVRRVSQDLSDVQLLEIDYSERRDAAGDVAFELERLSEELSADIEQDPELRGVIQGMLESRRTQLTELESGAADLVVRLGKLREGLLERDKWVDAYRSYIRERILWVRSVTGGIFPKPGEVRQGVAAMVDNGEWRRALDEARASTLSARARWLVVLAACLMLWGIGRTARANLEQAAEATRSYKTDSFQHTLRALVASILLATRFPSILLVIGLGLLWLAPQVSVAQAVASGSIAAALVLYVLRFVRAMALPKGLGQAHFRWPARTAEFVLLRIRRFSLPFAVCVGVIVAFDHSEPGRAAQLGRGVFCIAMGLLASVLFSILRPTGPVIAEYKKRRPGWLFRSAAPAVHRIAVAIPILLAVAAFAGYYYTALRLAERLALSVAFAVVLVLVYGLLLRWLFLARRRLAIEQARVRALAKAEAAKAQGKDDFVSAPIDESALDLPAVNAQTQQLFRFAISCLALVALLGIWSSTLPALRIFDRVQIWPSFELVEEGESNDPIIDMLAEGGAAATDTVGSGRTSAEQAGTPAPLVPLGRVPLGTPNSEEGAEESAQASDLPQRVTLADLGIAILILVLTLGAARNLPSFVEIVLLQRLDLDAGSRNAISTLVRYAILILGSVLGFGAVGLSWSSIQWLAAALTFGLAFGLQEIFANFVSGLIILIERPVRVGDIVTVAGTEGQVTRLRMRATTILDYNRRELLVPNREFITGSLVNWTLSDPITREIVKVGVAYGSDVELAHELLLRAAKESSLVVEDPAPQAIFRTFGDSCLDFELRVFMPNREIWARVVDDVHRRIDTLFREHNIEISFPQRDLHIRSMPSLVGAGEAPVEESEPAGPDLTHD